LKELMRKNVLSSAAKSKEKLDVEKVNIGCI
jgi:hypothetical protein